MKKIPYLFFFVLILVIVSCSENYNDEVADIELNDDWLFQLSDSTKTDENDWRKVNIPHDFSIEQPFSEQNTSGKGGGYAYAGVGVYRKHFSLDAAFKNKKVILYFDGIYRNSEVTINGHLLGTRPYGYIPFQYDITPFVNFGEKGNELKVKVNTTNQPNSRWYTGAGIFRKVRLHLSDKTHIIPYGVFASTSKVTDKEALINVKNELSSDIKSPDITVVTTLKDTLGETVAEITTDNVSVSTDTTVVEQIIKVKNPELWHPQKPYLYSLTTKLYRGSEVLDSYQTSYGIRTIEFDPNKGLIINGEKIKIKGVNNHHDGGPLGAACYDRTFKRQIEILKSMGCNALRMSHNPPASLLLDYADKAGMLVIDEIFDEWENGKCIHGYAPHFKEWHAQDIENWIRRDRNHASVIAWSLGNEIPEQTKPEGAQTFKMLKQTAQKFDNSHPFTAACNEIPKGNEYGYTEAMDIVGYNYREPHYAKDHLRYPQRIIYGSETAIYPYQPGDEFPLHSYNDWYNAQTADYVAGEFLWTGFDYLGEAGIGAGGTGTEPWKEWPKWPWRSADCGVIDLCGHPKPAYYFRKSLWTEEPMIYLAVQTDSTAHDPQAVPFWGWPKVQPHWNHSTPGDSLAVHIYTNCGEVELFLNNRLLGKMKHDLKNEAFLFTKVKYVPGTLKAVGRKADGKTTMFELKTASEPVNIELLPDCRQLKANNQSLCYVSVSLKDNNGTPVLFNDQTIEFSLTGGSEILAVGNGNPQSSTPFKGTKMETFLGKCLVIIKSGKIPGKVVLKATGESLVAESLTLDIE